MDPLKSIDAAYVMPSRVSVMMRGMGLAFGYAAKKLLSSLFYVTVLQFTPANIACVSRICIEASRWYVLLFL
jgi:hypothetical protein